MLSSSTSLRSQLSLSRASSDTAPRAAKHASVCTQRSSKCAPAVTISSNTLCAAVAASSAMA